MCYAAGIAFARLCGLVVRDAIARRAKANLATSTGGKTPQPLAMLPKVAIHTRAEVAKAAGGCPRGLTQFDICPGGDARAM